jgi:hypothetical protein
LENETIGKDPAVSVAKILRLYVKFQAGHIKRKQAATELGLTPNTFSQYATRNALPRLREVLQEELTESSSASSRTISSLTI